MTVPLLTQAPFAAPAALGTALTAGKPKRAGEPRRFGMTMWFEVIVQSPAGASHLGRWSGCSGLGMTMDATELWSGGQNAAPYYLPKSINFGRVTLERAMEPGSSRDVQHWLRRVAREWHESPEGAAALTGDKKPEGGAKAAAGGYAGTTVTITMFSSLGGDRTESLVCRWVLNNAIPVSWAGPKFASGAGGIAVETLTLVHRGFLNSESTGGDKAANASERTESFVLEHKGDKLTFQYNPAEVTLEKILDVDDDRIVKVDNTEFNKLNVSINDFTIEGVTAVRDKTAKLWSWIEPEPGTGDKPNPKKLSFTMGTGADARTIGDLHLKSVKVRYTRFTRSGVPCRAVVTISVVVTPDAAAASSTQPGQDKPGGTTPPPKGASAKPPEKPTGGTGRQAGEAGGVDDLQRPGLSRKAPA